MIYGTILQRLMSVGVLLVLLPLTKINADSTFEKLLKKGKYQDAIDYADEKLPTADRDAKLWNRIGEAYVHVGNNEKALACYLVSWRMKPENYEALLGVASTYNIMKQYDNAVEMAQKALEVKFTAEASWEYAKASIALGRAKEAKKAMEKVLEEDSSNVIAARELSNIYFREGAWSSAVPVLKLSFRKNGSGELAFQIGKAYGELNVPDSALHYLKMASEKGGPEAPLNLAYGRVYFDKKNFGKCVEAYRKVPSDSLNAEDYYRYGCAVEKTSGLSASASFFQKALSLADKNKENTTVLLSKEKIIRNNIDGKNFTDARRLIEELIVEDPKGKTVKDVYILGSEVYKELDNSKKAIECLEKAIAINSRNVKAYARLADLYQKNGMEEKAKKTFEVLLGLSPDNPEIYLALGEYNLEKKRYDKALDHYKKSNSLKKSVGAYAGIAEVYLLTKKYDTAIEMAKKALKLDASHDPARLTLAKSLIEKKMYMKAQEHLEKLLQRGSDNRETLLLIAACYEKNKAAEKLAEVDKKLISLNSSDTVARIRLAKYYETKGEKNRAIQLYKEVHTIAPTSVGILRKLSLLLIETKNADEAITYTRQYLEENDHNAEAHRDLGDLYYEKKKLDKALGEYRTALKLDPKIKGFYKRYAEIVIAKGEQDEVIKALSGVVASGNADVSTYMTLGLMYQKKKKYSDAIEMYQNALNLEPSNFDALVALAACQAEKKEIKNAIISYEQAVMMNAEASAEYRELGDLYIKEKRKDEAILAYVKFLDKDSTDTKIAQEVGEYFYLHGDFDKAFRYLFMAKKNLSVDNSIRFAETCLKKGETGEAIAVLHLLKTNKRITGNKKKTVFKLAANAFEADSSWVAAAKAYGDYAELKGVNDPEAAYKHALYTEKNNPVAAQKIFEKNVKKYPGDYRNFLRLGLLYSEQKTTITKAIPLFKKVTQLADSIPQVWLELGKIYRKIGKEKDELDAYRKYAEIDPQNIEANLRIGTIQMRRGEYNEAIVVLEMVNTLQPNDPEIMALLAKGYTHTNRAEEAIHLLKKAQEKKKDDAEIRFQLFKLYRKVGRKEDAQKEIEALIAIKRDAEYLLFYGEALFIQKKKDEALTAIEEILATNPENIDALLLKGRILRSQKKFDDAIDVYKEINYIDAGNTAAMVARAETHLEQSKPQWAESFFKRALRANPDLARAELGLAKTEKLKGNIEGYYTHLEKARILAPDDEAVQEEINKNK